MHKLCCVHAARVASMLKQIIGSAHSQLKKERSCLQSSVEVFGILDRSFYPPHKGSMWSTDSA